MRDEVATGKLTTMTGQKTPVLRTGVVTATLLSTALMMMPAVAAPTGTPATARTGHHKTEGATLAPDAAQKMLVEGNRRFRNGTSMHRDHVARRNILAGGQHPHTIVLACADSRVAPELVFDQGLGDLFVVRTAGNVADPVALGSIEYAVAHLGVRNLVVIGHENCGAVIASEGSGSTGSANIDAIVNRIRPSLAGIDARTDKNHHQGAMANARGSAEAMLHESPMLAKMVKDQGLIVRSGIYSLETGIVTFAGEKKTSGH